MVFAYIGYHWYKSQKEFQKESGINSFSPIESFKLFFNSPKEEPQLSAYKKLKQRSRKLFKIWILTLLVFIIVTFAVGILTAKKTN
jgi:hypothetical protein